MYQLVQTTVFICIYTHTYRDIADRFERIILVLNRKSRFRFPLRLVKSHVESARLLSLSPYFVEVGVGE